MCYFYGSKSVKNKLVTWRLTDLMECHGNYVWEDGVTLVPCMGVQRATIKSVQNYPVVGTLINQKRSFDHIGRIPHDPARPRTPP